MSRKKINREKVHTELIAYSIRNATYIHDATNARPFKAVFKGRSQDFIFQMSLFSTLADIFAYLETPPMQERQIFAV